MIGTLINILIAEIAALSTLTYLSTTPLRLFTVPLGVILITAPLIGVMFRKPFSIQYLALLIVLSSTATLKDSEVFLASLDVIYFFGYREVAEYLHMFFSQSEDADIFKHLLMIIWLYTTSVTISGVEGIVRSLKEKGIICEKCLIAYMPPLLITGSVFLIYPHVIQLRLVTEISPFFAGIAAVIIVVATAMILAKTSEVSIKVKSKF
jgi:hypothetical protein